MSTTEKRPLKVFLCHASTDKPKVRELYRYLKKRGIQPWFDEEDLVGGQDWQVEIPKALATSDAIIICLTKNSVDKEGYIQKEIKFALDKALEMPEGRIFLIPVKFEECEVPFTLSRYQWVDLTVESGYAKMMKALKFRASQLERSTVEVFKKDVEEENLAREKKEREATEQIERERKEKEFREKQAYEANEKEKRDTEKAEQERKRKLEKLLKENDRRLETAKRKYKWDTFFLNIRHRLRMFFIDIRYKFLPILFGLIAIGTLVFMAFYLQKILPELKINSSLISQPSQVSTEVFIPTATITVSSTSTENPTSASTSLPTESSLTTNDCLYEVVAGDTLLTIADKFGIGGNNWKSLSCASDDLAGCDMSNPDNIAVGWRLIVRDVNDDMCVNSGGHPQSSSETSLPTEITDAKGVSMVLVPAGEFLMGSDSGLSVEQPVHQVYLDGYYIDKYEVSNAAYKTCVETGNCTPPQKDISYTRSRYYGNSEFDDYPVIYVDWSQSKTYCEWREGRLPTEAEWEKAARGTESRKYPWGEGIGCKFTNYWGKDGGCVGDTTKVGTYVSGVSPYGVHDMAGNVWEWVNDWYDSEYYQDSPYLNPLGPSSGERRVLRGGSYADPGVLWSSYRFSLVPDNIYHYFFQVGFRCARSLP